MAWSRIVESKLPAAVAIYSVSVIEDAPRLLRGLIVSNIRKGVPEDLHDRFLVASKRASGWKDLASYSEPASAYIVLTDRRHSVIWRASGPATEASIQALVEQISALSSSAARTPPEG